MPLEPDGWWSLPFADARFQFKRMPQGSWSWTVYGGWKDVPARVVVAIACPVCNRLFNLSGHTVSAEGVVNPSVVCSRSECSWHVMVKLAGYHAAPALPQSAAKP